MDIQAVKKICVLGAGQMGKQIALNCALYGYDTTVYDAFEKALEGLKGWAEGYLDSRVKKGKLTEEQKREALAHFHAEPSLQAAGNNADIVIEAVIEDMDIKNELFQKLDGIVRADTIIATNSSYMPSSKFAQSISNPGRLANMHYFNPALVMQLVEVVKGEHTAEETIETLMEFARKTGKSPIYVRQEIEGFIVNRIILKVLDEAYYLMENGIATVEEIDLAMEKGANYPMGPFRLEDFTGIDTTYYIKDRQFKETGEKPIGYDSHQKKVEAGELGRKTGKGWYSYEQ